MLLRSLLLLLPACAFGGITIKLKVAKDESQASVELLGSNVDVISDTEQKTWQIAGDQLKQAVSKYEGGYPDDAYVRSPTPWGDLYKSYGWDQVQRTLIPRSAKILGIRSEPVIITTQEFINNSSVKATYNAGISQSVDDSVTTSWSNSGGLTVGQEFTYSLEFAAGQVGGSTSMTFSANWGHETSKTHTVTIGSTSGVTVELAPGEAVMAILSATRGTMEVQVDYQAHLSGDVACNFSGTFKGHHFWAYDINSCLKAAGKPTTVDSTETIKIGFYSDASIEVRDRKGLKKTVKFV